MRPQSNQSVASRALAVLLAADDSMPEAWHPVWMTPRQASVVILLDTTAAWSAWVVAVQRRADGRVSAQASLHVSTAEAVVCGCPVMVVCGDCTDAESGACRCLVVRHAITASEVERVRELRDSAASKDLAEFYGQRLESCPTASMVVAA
jgi:hypothetical protein